MAEIITLGTTAASSADFTVAAGGSTSLFIKGATEAPPTGATFDLYHKNTGSGAGYSFLLRLTHANIMEKGTIAAAGTYQVRRVDSANGGGASACGMDRE